MKRKLFNHTVGALTANLVGTRLPERIAYKCATVPHRIPVHELYDKKTLNNIFLFPFPERGREHEMKRIG